MRQFFESQGAFQDGDELYSFLSPTDRILAMETRYEFVVNCDRFQNKSFADLD